MDAFVHILMRFLHIASIVTLVGAILYARLVLTPVLNELPEADRAAAASSAQAKFKQTVFILLVLIIGSGTYNLIAAGHHTLTWQTWFGIKMLLVMHVAAASVLWALSPYGDVAVGGKGKRRLAGLAISGLLVILISNYLRWLSMHGG
jgi:hypothetical protein